MDLAFFGASFLVLLLAGASALVARAAARDGRARLRDLVLDLERLAAEHEGLLVRLRRVEGRQTARIGRDQPADPNGLPDPRTDPEAWRAAVRRMAIKSPKQSELM